MATLQTQDYFTYTAVKYAKDAGHETIVDLLGGEEEGWVDVEEVYTGVDAGEDGEASGPTGGLWIRHMDPQTDLAYYMNDETGELLSSSSFFAYFSRAVSPYACVQSYAS